MAEVDKKSMIISHCLRLYYDMMFVLHCKLATRVKHQLQFERGSLKPAKCRLDAARMLQMLTEIFLKGFVCNC